MKLGRPAKILALILTLLPPLYVAFFIANIAFAFADPAGAKNAPVFRHFGLLMTIHLSVMLLMFGLLAFYVVFLFKTPAIRNDMKALWAVVLFFGGVVAMPVFWYLYVWKEPANTMSSP
jgi:uncharacterized membrane protein YidH (DUF202 family)